LQPPSPARVSVSIRFATKNDQSRFIPANWSFLHHENRTRKGYATYPFGCGPRLRGARKSQVQSDFTSDISPCIFRICYAPKPPTKSTSQVLAERTSELKTGTVRRGLRRRRETSYKHRRSMYVRL